MSSDPRSNSTALIGIFVTVLGLVAAVLVGQLVAKNDFTKIGAIFGAAMGMTVVLIMGRNIWLLIPLCWPLTGKIQILPIPLNVQELAIGAAAGFYVLQVIFKKRLHSPRTGAMEFLLVLNIAWLATVYFRNPVGVRAMGTEMLGGRPYFEVVAACLAFWVLTRTIISPKLGRVFPILMGAGSLIVSGIGIMTTIFPRLTPLVAPFYSGVDTTAYKAQVLEGGSSDSGVGRLTMLRGYGTQMAAVLFALFSPIRLLNPINIIPFALFLSCIAAIFLSGFRGALIGTGASFVIASYFWGGPRDAIRAIFLALAAIVLLVAAQSVGISLPKSAQRALSFIPADWDQEAVRDAEGTTDWRIDMWKTVLDNPKKFLRNPILGSGFGFSSEDLAIQLSAYYGGVGYSGASQFENQLITGAYHNGPLSTIRFVGIIGLILFYTLYIYMVVYAFRLVKTTKGTPYFYLAVFLATPTIYGLFSYTFIYGAFDGALQQALFTCAMLRCTTESLRLWRAEKSFPTTAIEEPVSPLQGGPKLPFGPRLERR